MAAQALDVMVSAQVTVTPAEEAVSSHAPAATSLLVEPVSPALRRFPVFEVGTPSLPIDALSITTQSFASWIVIETDGCVDVPVALVTCPIATTPEYSLTVVTHTDPAERVTVTEEIEGQFWPIHTATDSLLPLLVVFLYGKNVHPAAVTLLTLDAVVFHASPTLTVLPAVVAPASVHVWLVVLLEVCVQVVADPGT
jgi:hypothetical protein